MKHSLLLLSVVPLAFLQCKSRGTQEPTTSDDVQGTVNVPTNERIAAIQEADAWGEYWEPGMSKAQVDAKDAEVVNAISSRVPYVSRNYAEGNASLHLETANLYQISFSERI